MGKKKDKYKSPASTGVTPDMGPEAVKKHNKKMRENASPKAQALANSVDQAFDQVNSEMEDLFFGEAFEHKGKTYYKASDTSKEVLDILRETGLTKEQLASRVKSINPGDMTQLGGTWYIKRVDNKLQEVTKYVFTLEKMLSAEREKLPENLGFVGHIKAAFGSLLGKTV